MDVNESSKCPKSYQIFFCLLPSKSKMFQINILFNFDFELKKKGDILLHFL